MKRSMMGKRLAALLCALLLTATLLPSVAYGTTTSDGAAKTDETKTGVTVACLLIMGTFSLVAYNANENLADLQKENARLNDLVEQRTRELEEKNKPMLQMVYELSLIHI